MENYTQVRTNSPELKVFQDWDNDGFLRIDGSRTGKLYLKLQYETHPDCIKHRCFFAFSKEQFEQGIKSIKLDVENGEKVISAGLGLYGTKEGLDSFYKEYDSIRERIRTECNPEDVYFEEYNNHECCIDYDGDEQAIAKIINIWGMDEARKIKRLRNMYTLADVKKRMH